MKKLVLVILILLVSSISVSALTPAPPPKTRTCVSKDNYISADQEIYEKSFALAKSKLDNSYNLVNKLANQLKIKIVTDSYSYSIEINSASEVDETEPRFHGTSNIGIIIPTAEQAQKLFQVLKENKFNVELNIAGVGQPC